MKFSCPTSQLRLAITTAERLTGKNLSLPALAHLYLAVVDDQVVIRSTNLDIGLELKLAANQTKSGAVMVSGAVLGNFLSNLPSSQEITVELDKNILKLKGGRTQSSVVTYPVDDFPTIPRLTEGETVEFPVATMVAAFKNVWYAASLSDIKPEIASVYAYADNRDLVLVATDSFRLAEKKVSFSATLPDNLKLIIPFKNAVELVRVFEHSEEVATLSYTANQFTVTTPTVFFSSRLVDGIYPDYRQIVPTASTTRVVVSKPELQNALKISTIFSDKLNQISLRVDVESGRCELSARNSEVGESATELSARVEGETLEVSYNVKYLLDAFQSLNTDTISLSWNGKQRPLSVIAVGDPSFLYLVMPLNR